MPTIAEAIRETASRLSDAGIDPDEIGIESRLLVQRAAGVDAAQMLAWHSDQLVGTARERLEFDLSRRETREPLAYILGEKEFYGREFKVDRRVLIPRPETELLIDLCTQFVQHNHLVRPRICDIGTGSGIIAVTLAHEIQESRLTAVDVSRDALEIAKSNAQRHGLNADRVKFVLDDATQNRASGDYHIVVSNPPYIRSDALLNLEPEVRDWEPRQALDGGHDGMDVLRPLIRSLPNLLRDDVPAAAFIEIDPPVVDQCLETAHKTMTDGEIQVHRDYAGLERVLVVLLV